MQGSGFELNTRENAIKVVIRRKGVDAPLMIARPGGKKGLETDGYGRELNTRQGAKFRSIDERIKSLVPPLRFVNISTYDFSQTPTPNRDKKNPYFIHTFDTHSSSKPTSRNVSTDIRENLKTVYSATRRVIASGPGSNTGSQLKVYTEKLTMRDLNLNLPTIIKSKKVNKRLRFNFNL